MKIQYIDGKIKYDSQGAFKTRNDYFLHLIKEKAVMNNLNLSWLKIRDADLSNVDFNGSDFTSTELINCNLTNAKFTNCNLLMMNITDSKLDHVDFRWTKRTKLKGLDMTEMNYDGKYPIYLWQDMIQIGCKTHSILEWKENIQLKRYRNFATNDEEYDFYVNFLIQQINQKTIRNIDNL